MLTHIDAIDACKASLLKPHTMSYSVVYDSNTNLHIDFGPYKTVLGGPGDLVSRL